MTEIGSKAVYFEARLVSGAIAPPTLRRSSGDGAVITQR
jgi:hypothetical protein